MAALGLMMAALELMPMPREVEWRDGTCTFAESDVRFARDAALPPEGYRIDISSNGVAVASADDACPEAFATSRRLKRRGEARRGSFGLSSSL